MDEYQISYVDGFFSPFLLVVVVVVVLLILLSFPFAFKQLDARKLTFLPEAAPRKKKTQQGERQLR